jgi:glucose-6-phosphate-specific signal transduction histidine kinase
VGCHDRGISGGPLGGASFSGGSGLLGLKDRAEALGGHIRLHSPAGAGTALEITLPFHDPGAPRLSPAARSVVAADVDVSLKASCG